MRIVTIARKPLSAKHPTVASNVAEFGCGALAIDATRISTTKGRWPANMILQHRPECQCTGTREVKGSHDTTGVWGRATSNNDLYGDGWVRDRTARRDNYTSPDGTETVAAWDCEPDCPVADLDGQSGKGSSWRPNQAIGSSTENTGMGGRLSATHNDSGGASRFFKQVRSD